jgi:hypothetical protein
MVRCDRPVGGRPSQTVVGTAKKLRPVPDYSRYCANSAARMLVLCFLALVAVICLGPGAVKGALVGLIISTAIP